MKPSGEKKTIKRRAIRLEDVRAAMSDALVNILMPLSQLALEAGLSIEDVYRLLRFAAVNQMSSATKAESLGYSISGIAAATGIPRAEVSKLLKQPFSVIKPGRTNEQTTNTILSAWREDSRFTTPEGQPASLAMYGRGRSFERLAKIHGRGIPTRALLEELKRTNSISIGPDQVVHANAVIALERGIDAASVRAFGDRVSKLMTTIAYNMQHPTRARLVSGMSSKQIPSKRLPLVRREITKMTEHYLSEVQDLLARNSKLEGASVDGTALSITLFCSESAASAGSTTGKRRKNYRRIA